MIQQGRLILIGEAPGPGKKGPTLQGRAGKRLAGFVGITLDDLVRQADLLNLLDEYPGPTFPKARGRSAAAMLSPTLADQRVIALGQNVAHCLGLIPERDRFPILLWTPLDLWGGKNLRCRAAVVPHPSGLNRWYNVSANRDLVREFLCEAFGVNQQREVFEEGVRR